MLDVHFFFFICICSNNHNNIYVFDRIGNKKYTRDCLRLEKKDGDGFKCWSHKLGKSSERAKSNLCNIYILERKM